MSRTTRPAEYDRAAATVPRNVSEDDLVDVVMVEQVMRGGLVEPNGFAGIHVTSEDSGGPFVVAGPLVGIPRARVADAIINELRLGVIAEPTPGSAAADLPRLGRPRLDS